MTKRVMFISALKVKQTRGDDCFLFNRVAYDKVMINGILRGSYVIKILLDRVARLLSFFHLHEFTFEVFIQGDNLDVRTPLSSYAD